KEKKTNDGDQTDGDIGKTNKGINEQLHLLAQRPFRYAVSARLLLVVDAIRIKSKVQDLQEKARVVLDIPIQLGRHLLVKHNHIKTMNRVLAVYITTHDARIGP